MVEVHVTVIIIICVNMTVELDFYCMLWLTDFPWVTIPHPEVRNFYLFTSIVNTLFEKAGTVTDAVSVKSIVQGCARIHEACCKSAKTTVSKTWIQFQLCNFFIVDVKILETFHNHIIDAKIFEVACQHLTKQKFDGKIVNLFCVEIFNGSLCVLPVDGSVVTYHVAQNHILLGWMSFFNRTAIRLNKATGVLAFEFRLILKHFLTPFFSFILKLADTLHSMERSVS